MMRTVYLDHTATTPLAPEVLEAMTPYFAEKFGNASSIHRLGREAKAALDESRAIVARAIGAETGEVYFVSSGTEADNFALKGVAEAMQKLGKNHIVTSAIEHHAVLDTCRYLEMRGFDVTYVGVDGLGRVDPDNIRRAIRPATGLISIMHVNNEVGTIQAIDAIGSITKERGIAFHTDAVQSFGKLSIDVGTLGIDLLSISAHKIYGPKGIGALYIRRGVNIEQLLHGGGQERGRRAGTENVPLAVGLARATSLLQQLHGNETARLIELKHRFLASLTQRFHTIIVNGHPMQSVPHIVNVSFDSSQIEIDDEALLFNLDLAGIAVTSGSACTSGSNKPSHVLLAMGRDQRTASATLRFSMGRSTTGDDLDYVVEKLDEIVQKIGKRRKEN